MQSWAYFYTVRLCIPVYKSTCSVLLVLYTLLHCGRGWVRTGSFLKEESHSLVRIRFICHLSSSSKYGNCLCCMYISKFCNAVSFSFWTRRLGIKITVTDGIWYCWWLDVECPFQWWWRILCRVTRTSESLKFSLISVSDNVWFTVYVPWKN